jgi:Ca-activated chloride channel family protein
VLDTLWARAAVADLEVRLWSGPDAEAEAEITRLGLEHHIVTAFTSFVAVDRSRVVGDGDPRLVVEPTIVPEGVDPEMAGAAVYDSAGVSLAGTTAAEAEYAAEAESMDEPAPIADATRGYAQVVESRAIRVERRSSKELHGEPWAPNARLVIGRPSAAPGVRTAPVRTAVREARGGMRSCYEGSSAFSRDDRHHLRLRITFRDGQAPKIELVDGSIAGSVDACMIAALERVSWPSLAAGTVVEIPLHMSAR